MKIKMIFLRQILLIVILTIFFKHEVYSQSNGSTKWKQPGFFFGIGLGTSKSQIINSGIASVSNLLYSANYSLSESVELGYFFSKYFGLTSGLSYYSYETQLDLDTYQNQINTFDIENEAYELRIIGSDIKEIQQVSILGVPICINIRMPLNKTIGFYVQTGVNLAFPVNKNYKTSGTFTYKGYFPAYNVLLENLPEYGFASNLQSESEGELELKPMSCSLVASAGFDYLIQKRFQVAVAAYYDKSLTSISDYSVTDKFQLSTDATHLNSFMIGSSKTTLQSIGLKILLRYYITDYTKFKYYSHPSIKRTLREYQHRYKGFVH
jgi:hypothetical protein